MATEQDLFANTYIAAADLRTKQYYIMDINASSQILAGTSGSSANFGILQDKANTGEGGLVCHLGISKCVASEAIDPGEYITSDADGKGAVATSGDAVVGRALSIAGEEDDVFSVLVIPGVAP